MALFLFLFQGIFLRHILKNTFKSKGRKNNNKNSEIIGDHNLIWYCKWIPMDWLDCVTVIYVYCPVFKKKYKENADKSNCP